MAGNNKLAATTLVIFGITGDLSRRYILPSLTALSQDGRLPKQFKIIGLSRRNVSPDDVLKGEARCLADYLAMHQIDMADKHDYEALKKQVLPGSQIIFYFAVPPVAVAQIIDLLKQAGLNGPKSKLLLEKPFGFDLESAQKLVKSTTACFKESQIYRIDHYMAKEMAQNIVVFLGSNALFRDVWNNQFIESINITAAEQIGIEGRVDFYESIGALRDYVPNHLMNLAALVLMRPCTGVFEFSEIPSRRLEALKSLKIASRSNVIRGQYKGYRAEVGQPSSTTETFVSLKLYSKDPRWQGVPITLTTGKKLNQKLTEIRVRFKKAEVSQTNTLVLRIQPQEGIEIDLWAKQPGYDHQLRHMPLKFSYSEQSERLPDAYEHVLLESIRSDQSLFASSDEILQMWRVLKPLTDYWDKSAKDLFLYQPGSSAEQISKKHL